MIRKSAMIAAAMFAVAPVIAKAQLLATRVAGGALAGTREGTVAAFLGVPFAAPPVGENRWKPPLPAAAWQGVRKAAAMGASCQQEVTPNGFGPWTHEYVVGGNVSEDCLFVNVWTPAKKAAAKLPVMVWIHGGAFSSGSGAVPIYDGAALAARGIVVVSINYRLGVYGFLAHPQLTEESPARASGNYALLDQVAALKWVQRNIAAFGGDPSRVTIAGQSAGAASVHHMIATPLASGLFVRAITQSGTGIGTGLPSRAQGEQAGLDLQRAAGALDLAALRQLSPAKIDAAVKRMPSSGPTSGLRFAPIRDGLVLTDTVASGNNINDIPILTGLNANEMTGLNPTFGKATRSSILEDVKREFGTLAPRVATLYPVDGNADANAALEAIARDKGLAVMEAWAGQRKTRQPIYIYLWTHVEPGPDAARFKAFHSSEIPYVFGTLSKAPERNFTAEDRRVSDLVSQYWVNWVKAGNPNGQGLPHWPRYTEASKQILEIGYQVKPRPVLPADKLMLLQEYDKSGGRLSLF